MGTTHIPDVRRPVQLSNWGVAVLSFQTLGIIYSDIGTSPLYVLNGIWSPSAPAPSKEDVIGGISCIIWALTLLPLLKYVFVALRFGTEEGEGGCFALYHGLVPPKQYSEEDDRTLTGDSTKPAPRSRDQLLRFKWVLLPWTLFGTSLTIADGVFTPSVSITSAVGGIAVGAPSVSNKIIPISVAFLVVLFLAQRLGTNKLAVMFAPVTFIWMGLIAITGIINITKFPGIWRAFDPSRAIELFVRTKNYDLLAGVLLAITGCEALFANLGQFNRISIQLSFGAFVYPCLVFAYLGQGARLIVDGDDVISNVFYKTIPGAADGPLFWVMYVFAILATLIASQAMITATFSLIQQVIHLKSFPPLRMLHTSEKIQGQVYIPAVNWILAAMTLVVVGAFKSSVALSNAYGFAVATVMFVTTTLLAIQCHYVKHLPWFVTVAFFIFFGFFDGLFFGAAIRKVPHGAWVPLMIGGVLLILMVFWSWAKALEDDFDSTNRKNLRHFMLSSKAQEMKAEESSLDDEIHPHDSQTDVVNDNNLRTLTLAPDERSPSRDLVVVPMLAIFHKFSNGKGVPHSFAGFLRQYPAIPRVTIFLSVRVMPMARMPVEERFIVTKVRTLDGFYGVTYQLGFRDDYYIDVRQIVEDICKLEQHAKGVDPRDSDSVLREIREDAQGVTHIVPHYNVVSKALSTEGKLRPLNPLFMWVREVLIEDIYRRMVTMFPETANWKMPADEIIYVGVTARI